jgi:hypothetical protein
MNQQFSQDNEWMCVKHGVYRPVDPAAAVFPNCPKCQEVAKKGLCVDCESHAGTVNFSESTMSYIHGMTKKICRCCYRKIVEKAYLDAKENFEKLSTDLALEPCWPVEDK